MQSFQIKKMFKAMIWIFKYKYVNIGKAFISHIAMEPQTGNFRKVLEDIFRR